MVEILIEEGEKVERKRDNIRIIIRSIDMRYWRTSPAAWRLSATSWAECCAASHTHVPCEREREREKEKERDREIQRDRESAREIQKETEKKKSLIFY